METLEIISIAIWASTFLAFALITFWQNTKRIHDRLGGLDLNELTVIIPFRNEAQQLPKLCEALLLQKSLPAKILFVDDHSNDGSDTIIRTQLKVRNVPYEILKLSDLTGKKHALMTGVQHANTTYCLMMDADVWFDAKFFENLPEPGEYEMQILPVRMIGDSPFTRILELEYGSFQILQGLVTREKPLMASGANLLVKTTIYKQFNSLEEHAHRSSGDDQYALAQFLRKNRKIRTYFDQKLAVYTQTPQTFKELFRQRVRWMGNNTQGHDWRATFFSALVLVFNTAFLIFIATALFQNKLLLLAVIFLIKILIDLVFYMAWFHRNSTWGLILYLPALSILYPFYLITLGLSYLLMSRNLLWKNRPVVAP